MTENENNLTVASLQLNFGASKATFKTMSEKERAEALENMRPKWEERRQLGTPDGVKFEVAGAHHCRASRHVDVGETVSFIPEPTNRYDHNAVRVCRTDGSLVGYVPRSLNKMRLPSNGVVLFKKIDGNFVDIDVEFTQSAAPTAATSATSPLPAILLIVIVFFMGFLLRGCL